MTVHLTKESYALELSQEEIKVIIAGLAELKVGVCLDTFLNIHTQIALQNSENTPQTQQTDTNPTNL